MRRPSRLKHPRLLRRDWIGDAVLTLVCGALLLVSLFLPWVNEDGSGDVNFSLTSAVGTNGVLQTPWGIPALVLATLVICTALVMLFTRPRRFSLLFGALTSACGAAVFFVAQDAAAHVGFLDPGVGMYVTTLVGVLLVPIGFAAALVAHFLARADTAHQTARS